MVSAVFEKGADVERQSCALLHNVLDYCLPDFAASKPGFCCSLLLPQMFIIPEGRPDSIYEAALGHPEP